MSDWQVGDIVDAPFVWHVPEAADAIDGSGCVTITPEIQRALRAANPVCDDPDWCARWPSCGHTPADFGIKSESPR